APSPGRSARPFWREPPSATVRLGRGALLGAVALMVLVPAWSILVTSVASKETIEQTGGMVMLPRELDLSAYVAIFSGGQLPRALGVSALVALLGTSLSLVSTVLAAYALSRPSLFGQRPLLAYFLLAFLLYPGLVPSYLVVSGLGLKDT